MRVTNPEPNEQLINVNSGWLTAIAIFTIVLGIIAIVFPFFATIASTLVFGWVFVVAGIAQIVYAVQSKRAGQVIWKLILGLLYLLAGIIVLVNPLQGALALTLVFMLTISLELAKKDATYEDIASKFFEHFLYIADAIDGVGEAELSLWDETDGFYYDALHLPDGQNFLMKVRSVVGLAPLFAVTALQSKTLERFPSFKRRTKWFMQNRPDLTQNVVCLETEGVQARMMLAIAGKNQLRRVLEKMLDEKEFFSPHGIRALSKFHANNPYAINGLSQRISRLVL